MNKFYKFSFVIAVLMVSALFSCLPADAVFASTGTIDSTYKYAWSNNIGWINFAPTGDSGSYAGLTVSDTAITGYAWSPDYGWINFNPSNSTCTASADCGVKNTTSGVLSGNAWGENIGWINFSGVTINTSTGVFSGTATGDVVGTINFSCADNKCKVVTGWGVSGCGDGSCSGGETCSTCSADCGGCGGGPVTVITCTTDSNCGTDGYTGPLSCQSENVYQDYITYVCNSPGTTSSSCSSSTASQLKTACPAGQTCSGGSCVSSAIACSTNADCGSNGYADSPVCQDGNVFQNYVTYTCNSPGLVSSNCSNSVQSQLKTTCPAGQVCDGGGCVVGSIACTASVDCGVSGYTDLPVCQDGSVYQNYITYVCHNPGIADSFCSNSTEAQLKIACFAGQACVGGSCIIQGSAQHNECNAQKQCVSVIGIDSDYCQTDSDCGGTGIGGPIVLKNHNECNAQKQCVSVSGEGSNDCQADGDCAVSEPMKVVEVIGGTIQKSFEKPIETVKTIAQETKKIIETPQGSAVTKTITTAGATVATVEVVSAIFFSPLEIFLIILRLSGIFLTAVGIRKRVKPWGVVYDSVTKQPLDPAYVTLKDSKGKDIASAITDLDGRYGFLVSPGVYQLSASKTNYDFPSQKLAGRVRDEFYNDLYFGGSVEVKEGREAIIKNIPMDPLKFDWNEFAKKDKKLMKFYSRFDMVLRKIIDLFFVVGFFVAIVAYFAAPYPYNLIILIVYLALLGLRFTNIRPRSYGNIIDGATGNPLSFSVLKIMMPDSSVEIAHKVADKYGRYYCLVPPGRYYVKIEKKNEDGSYSLVYTSSVINASKKGIIKNKFVI